MNYRMVGYLLGIILFIEAALLTVPVLAVVLTLLIATPVASEFRYAYAVFTCLPMMTAAVFCQDDKEALAGHG